MAEPEQAKLYYSIGQVSELTQLDPHVLRYWETEFRELSPRKNRGGKRLYRDNDIKLLLKIKELLYEKRFTIEGARRALREQKSSVHVVETSPSEPTTVSSDKIEELRRGLLELKMLLG